MHITQPSSSGSQQIGPSSSAVRATTRLTDVRTVGPVLLMVFGFVLMFTPVASVGVAGSVGNAGNTGIGGKTLCLPFSVVETWPYEDAVEHWANCLCPGNAGGGGQVAFVTPDMDPCRGSSTQPSSTTTTPPPTTTTAPTTTTTTTTTLPPTTTTAPTTTTLPPTTTTTTAPTTTAPTSTTTTIAPATTVSDDDSDASPVAPPRPAQLPATGNDRSSGIASTLGMVLVIGGVALLIGGRRRHAES